LAYLAENLLLLPGVFDLQPMITLAWSLSYEMTFYLSVPGLILMFRRLRWASNTRVRAILLLCVLYTLSIWLFFPSSVAAIAFSPWVHTRILLFAAGMIAWEWVKAQPKPPHPSRAADWAAALMAIVALAMLVPLANPVYQQPWPSIVRAFLLGSAFCWFSVRAYRDGSALGRALCWNPLRWLGNCSYSLFLIHALAVQATAPLFQWLLSPTQHQRLWFLLLLPVVFLSALAPAVALYLLIERPYSLRRPLRGG
jgi:exopolysaccharide production protein ExoZ